VYSAKKLFDIVVKNNLKDALIKFA